MATPTPKVDPFSSHLLRPPLYGTFPSPQPYDAVPAGVAYQTAVVAEGLPVRILRVRDPPLPLCGIGVGWALFVAGFFFAAVPWYVGAFILLFVSMDDREKAGLVACTVAAVLAAITAILGLSGHNPFW